jgi:hypothetical protein
VIDPQFVDYQPVIFLVFGEQIFQTFDSCRLLLFDGLDEIAIGAPVSGMVNEKLLIFGNLFKQEILLILQRHADSLEAAVGHDNAVPFAAGDFGGEKFPAVTCQILLGGDQQLGVGVEAA